MRRAVSLTAALVVLVSGLVATLVLALAPAAASPRALYCARPVDPTLNTVVQTVCSRFGP